MRECRGSGGLQIEFDSRGWGGQIRLRPSAIVVQGPSSILPLLFFALGLHAGSPYKP